MLAVTPEWVGDATSWLALITTAGVMGAGVARWVNRGLDDKIGHKIDHAVGDLKTWITDAFAARAAADDERWDTNTAQHGEVVAKLDVLENRVGAVEGFIEHQIEREGFHP